MVVSQEVRIHGTKAAVWSAVTEVDRWPEIIRGVRQIEVVARPESGVLGLRWKETRLLFDQPETVEKVVTESVEGVVLTTRAEQDGFVFTTTHRWADHGNEVVLTSVHETKPQTFVARLKSLPLVFFRGVLRKAILDDLMDIKHSVEVVASSS